MKKLFILIIIICNLTPCFGKNIKNNMENSEQLKIIVNSDAGLFARLNAINNIDLMVNKEIIINKLIDVLNRQKPQPIPYLINFDPIAEERVIDIHLIKALNKLGYTNENNRISVLVSQAIPFISEFGDERKEHAKVIKSINDEQIITQITELTKSDNLIVIENSVVVLNNLELPNIPFRGDIASILPNKKIRFQFSDLKKELELYVLASHGKIELSRGVKDFIETNTIERGNVDLELSLVDVIEKILPNFFDYYIENNKIIICTYTESVKNWQKWQDEN